MVVVEELQALSIDSDQMQIRDSVGKFFLREDCISRSIFTKRRVITCVEQYLVITDLIITAAHASS